MNVDEIVKALRLCAHDDCDCRICPFCNVAFDCGEQMKLAAADLIESLQSQLAESQRREQAAVACLEAVEINLRGPIFRDAWEESALSCIRAWRGPQEGAEK